MFSKYSFNAWRYLVHTINGNEFSWNILKPQMSHKNEQLIASSTLAI